MKEYDFQKYNIYPTFRKHQEETIRKVVDFCQNSSKRYLFVQAPTGSGKSIIAYVAAHYLTDFAEKSRQLNDKNIKKENIINNAYLLTSKNLLLDQYYNDFSRKMTVCKGRANYRCNLDSRPCSEGVCLTKSKPNEMTCFQTCIYQQEKMKMIRAKVSATNFAYLLKLLRGTNFQSKDLVIVDECQAMEAALRDEFVVQMTESTLKTINNLKEKMRKGEGHDVLAMCLHRLENRGGNLKKINISKVDYNNLDNVNKFLEHVYEEVAELFYCLANSIEEYINTECNGDEQQASQDKEFKELVKNCDSLKHLASSIKDYFMLKSSVEWVVDEHKTPRGEITGVEIKPVTIELLTTSLLKKLASKKIVMMSATIGDPKRFAKSIGIPYEEVEFIDVPSTFPAENRPFIKWPICSMSYKDMEENMPKIAEACDMILDMYQNKKGIIHSVSFKNAIYLKEHMRNSNRILIHDQVNKNLVLEQFKNSKNKILVSPSLIEGFDFKGDLSEFQIFIKIPYMSLKDKVVARRLQLDEEWYVNNAVLQILQGVGRSVRSETDVATTFCLDNNINFLLSKYRYLFTADFLNTVVDVRDYK